MEETDLDPAIAGERVPSQTSGNRVTPLVDGAEYFGALRAEVDSLKGPGDPNRFFYFTDWLLSLVTFSGTQEAGGTPSAWPQELGSEAFHLDDSSGAAYPEFIDELEAMHDARVDVRALAWVSPFVLDLKQAAAETGMYGINGATLLSVKAMRERLGTVHKAVLNVLAHPLGAMHLKMVVTGDNQNARAYISGIDLAPSRVTSRVHSRPSNFWHDAGAKVEGPAVDAAYRYFKLLWDEQVSRGVERFRFADARIPTHDEDTPRVPERTFLPIPGGKHWVQVLRTAPQFHLSMGPLIADENDPNQVVPVNCFKRLIGGFSRPKLSFAEDGIFEFRPALKKAILAARNYIYVEDQAFTGREIFGWIRQAMLAAPALTVIFAFGRDPGDPGEFLTFMQMGFVEHLGQAPLPANFANRVVFATRTDDTIMHSKLWIIDDEYVAVGSTNMMRRSLYTDGEIAVSVLDEDDAGGFALKTRESLWAEHCGVVPPADTSAFANLVDALAIWNPTWGSGAAPGTLVGFENMRVPFEQGTGPGQWANLFDPSAVTAQQRALLDRGWNRKDADSRQEI